MHWMRTGRWPVFYSAAVDACSWRRYCALAASAGKKVSRASSARVSSFGVPNTVVVLFAGGAGRGQYARQVFVIGQAGLVLLLLELELIGLKRSQSVLV